MKSCGWTSDMTVELPGYRVVDKRQQSSIPGLFAVGDVAGGRSPLEPAYPARTVVCFSSMLTGATPAEHGMRSNFAPRLGVRQELEQQGRAGTGAAALPVIEQLAEKKIKISKARLTDLTLAGAKKEIYSAVLETAESVAVAELLGRLGGERVGGNLDTSVGPNNTPEDLGPVAIQTDHISRAFRNDLQERLLRYKQSRI